jgi:putative serine protease PepD
MTLLAPSAIPQQAPGPSRFCSTCGAERRGEHCPRCAAAALRRPTGRRRGLVRGLAVLLVTGTIATSVAVGLDARHDAAHAQRELDDAVRRLRAGEQHIAALTTTGSSLASRLASLEQTVNGTPDPAEVAKQSAPSVFTVVTDEGTGSGFVATSEGGSAELVTNYHVVEETYAAGGRTVRVKRDDLTYTGRIVRVSRADDLAVVRLPLDLPALPLAAERPEVGDPLLALGSPLGLGGTVTSGIVSAFRVEDGTPYLQFSAPISPGNSGGPVVDAQGRVVGVSVAKYVGNGAEGLALAVPAERLCPAVDIC